MSKFFKNIWVERILILVVGLLLGYLYTIGKTRDRIDFFESLAFKFGEVSYYRGCAENSPKSKDCKKALESFKKDNKDISNNFESIISKKNKD